MGDIRAFQDIGSRVANFAVRRIIDFKGESNVIYSDMDSQVLPMMPPEQYDLKGFSEEYATSADGSEIGIWYKPPSDPDKPTYVAFHGRTGHWGYANSQNPSSEFTPTYQDNCFRHKWLEAMAESGAGVVAVHTRGFGLSANPSIKTITEDALKQDMEAVDGFLQDKHIDHKQTIVTGESLGGAMATLMSETMNGKKRPPAMLGLVNTFSDMSRAIYELLIQQKVGPLQPFKWSSEDNIRKHMSDPLNTNDRLEDMSKDTRLYIAHSTDDDVVSKSHAKRLLDTAHGKNFNVTFRALVNKYRTEYERDHTSWNPQEVVKDMEATYRGTPLGLQAQQQHNTSMLQ